MHDIAATSMHQRNDAKGFGLTQQQLLAYASNGWVGPFDFLDEQQSCVLSEECEKRRDEFFSARDLKKSDHDLLCQGRPWFKSIHAHIPSLYDLCRRAEITDRVADILGDNLLAWGTAYIDAQPGHRHRWHVDVEHMLWDGITVFVGLTGMSELTTLNVVNGSHALMESPQELQLRTSDDIRTFLDANGHKGEIVPVPLRNGQFFIFAGRLWHASNNQSSNLRTSLIIQYASPSAEIRIPRSWDPPCQWSQIRPETVLARGSAATTNIVALRPPAGPAS